MYCAQINFIGLPTSLITLPKCLPRHSLIYTTYVYADMYQNNIKSYRTNDYVYSIKCHAESYFHAIFFVFDVSGWSQSLTLLPLIYYLRTLHFVVFMFIIVNIIRARRTNIDTSMYARVIIYAIHHTYSYNTTSHSSKIFCRNQSFRQNKQDDIFIYTNKRLHNKKTWCKRKIKKQMGKSNVWKGIVKLRKGMDENGRKPP